MNMNCIDNLRKGSPKKKLIAELFDLKLENKFITSC